MNRIATLLAHEEHLVGLDIRPTVITASQIVFRRDGTAQVVNLGWCPIKPGSDGRSIGREIRRLWRQHHLTTNTVCSCLRSRSAIVKHFVPTSFAPDVVAKTVYREAEESLQLPRKDILVDWQLGGSLSLSSPAGPEGEATGLMVAVPRRDVAVHMQILRHALLVPVVVDIPPLALGTLLRYAMRSQLTDHACALLDLSEQEAHMAVLSPDQTLHPSTCTTRLPSWEEAEDYLVDNISDEVRYQQFKLKRPDVAQVFMTGWLPCDGNGQGQVSPAADGTRSFVARMGRRLSATASEWDPLQAFDCSREVLQKIATWSGNRPSFAVSLGMGLRRD